MALNRSLKFKDVIVQIAYVVENRVCRALTNITREAITKPDGLPHFIHLKKISDFFFYEFYGSNPGPPLGRIH